MMKVMWFILMLFWLNSYICSRMYILRRGQKVAWACNRLKIIVVKWNTHVLLPVVLLEEFDFVVFENGKL